MVGNPGASLIGPENLRFWKMTGSGNDFVFFDARELATAPLESAELIAALCDRRRGIGADGIVLLEKDPEHAYAIRYFNRDGSLAEFCGNASLCSVRLAAELGIVDQEPFTFRTSSGPISGRLSSQGAKVGMPLVRDQNPAFDTPLEPGESGIGHARVGVPHLVVSCSEVDAVDVPRRGRALRRLQSLPAGANVNFVSRRAGEWAYRTYERGVEEETLACGSGAVATAAMLMTWAQETSPIRLRTRSGAPVTVSFEAGKPFLAGEGRLVFEGRLRDLFPAE